MPAKKTRSRKAVAKRSVIHCSSVRNGKCVVKCLAIRNGKCVVAYRAPAKRIVRKLVRKPVARKPAVKKVIRKPAAKKTSKKAAKKTAKKTTKKVTKKVAAKKVTKKVTKKTVAKKTASPKTVVASQPATVRPATAASKPATARPASDHPATAASKPASARPQQLEFIAINGSPINRAGDWYFNVEFKGMHPAPLTSKDIATVMPEVRNKQDLQNAHAIAINLTQPVPVPAFTRPAPVASEPGIIEKIIKAISPSPKKELYDAVIGDRKRPGNEIQFDIVWHNSADDSYPKERCTWSQILDMEKRGKFTPEEFNAIKEQAATFVSVDGKKVENGIAKYDINFIDINSYDEDHNFIGYDGGWYTLEHILDDPYIINYDEMIAAIDAFERKSASKQPSALKQPSAAKQLSASRQSSPFPGDLFADDQPDSATQTGPAGIINSLLNLSPTSYAKQRGSRSPSLPMADMTIYNKYKDIYYNGYVYDVSGENMQCGARALSAGIRISQGDDPFKDWTDQNVWNTVVGEASKQGYKLEGGMMTTDHLLVAANVLKRRIFLGSVTGTAEHMAPNLYEPMDVKTRLYEPVFIINRDNGHFQVVSDHILSPAEEKFAGVIRSEGRVADIVKTRVAYKSPYVVEKPGIISNTASVLGNALGSAAGFLGSMFTSTEQKDFEIMGVSKDAMRDYVISIKWKDGNTGQYSMDDIRAMHIYTDREFRDELASALQNYMSPIKSSKSPTPSPIKSSKTPTPSPIKSAKSPITSATSPSKSPGSLAAPFTTPKSAKSPGSLTVPSPQKSPVTKDLTFIEVAKHRTTLQNEYHDVIENDGTTKREVEYPEGTRLYSIRWNSDKDGKLNAGEYSSRDNLYAQHLEDGIKDYAGFVERLNVYDTQYPGPSRNFKPSKTLAAAIKKSYNH